MFSFTGGIKLGKDRFQGTSHIFCETKDTHSPSKFESVFHILRLIRYITAKPMMAESDTDDECYRGNLPDGDIAFAMDEQHEQHGQDDGEEYQNSLNRSPGNSQSSHNHESSEYANVDEIGTPLFNPSRQSQSQDQSQPLRSQATIRRENRVSPVDEHSDLEVIWLYCAVLRSNEH